VIKKGGKSLHDTFSGLGTKAQGRTQQFRQGRWGVDENMDDYVSHRIILKIESAAEEKSASMLG